MPDLSIVVVNWNALDLTSASLASLRTQTHDISYEVIVVDNRTTRDSSLTELPRRFPWIHFIANQTNLGFSKACNQGIAASNGRYVLLLNSDTVQVENALGKAVRYMDDDARVGALGILHLNDDSQRTVQPSSFAFPQPWSGVLGLLRRRRLATSLDLTKTAPHESDVDWICGSFLMMRRACLTDVGMLDERFFVYAEDIDWCLRARRAGWPVRFWPGAAMVHVGSSVRPFIRDKTFMHYRSHLTYIRKNHSLTAATAFYVAMNFRLSLGTLRQILRYLIGRAGAADVSERLARQLAFLLLRPTQSGLNP